MKEANFTVGEIVKLRLTKEIVMVVRIKTQYERSGYDYSVRMKDLGIVEFREEELEKKKMNEGWICPICGRGLAPWVKSCDCTKPVSVPRVPCPWGDHPVLPKYPATGDPLSPPTLTGDPLSPPTITICRGGS